MWCPLKPGPLGDCLAHLYGWPALPYHSTPLTFFSKDVKWFYLFRVFSRFSLQLAGTFPCRSQARHSAPGQHVKRHASDEAAPSFVLTLCPPVSWLVKPSRTAESPRCLQSAQSPRAKAPHLGRSGSVQLGDAESRARRLSKEPGVRWRLHPEPVASAAPLRG